jgi:hypothetical protein
MVEFIGFIISFLALVYLFIKQNSPPARQEHPPDYPTEGLKEANPFEEFRKKLDREAEAREATQRLPPPPTSSKVAKQHKRPPRLALKEHQMTSQIEERRLRNALEDRHIQSRMNHREGALAVSTSHHRAEEDRKMGPSRAQLALQRLTHRRDLIVYQEIIDKPKSMRPLP